MYMAFMSVNFLFLNIILLKHSFYTKAKSIYALKLKESGETRKLIVSNKDKIKFSRYL